MRPRKSNYRKWYQVNRIRISNQTFKKYKNHFFSFYTTFPGVWVLKEQFKTMTKLGKVFYKEKE